MSHMCGRLPDASAGAGDGVAAGTLAASGRVISMPHRNSEMRLRRERAALRLASRRELRAIRLLAPVAESRRIFFSASPCEVPLVTDSPDEADVPPVKRRRMPHRLGRWVDQRPASRRRGSSRRRIGRCARPRARHGAGRPARPPGRRDGPAGRHPRARRRCGRRTPVHPVPARAPSAGPPLATADPALGNPLDIEGPEQPDTHGDIVQPTGAGVAADQNKQDAPAPSLRKA